MNYFQLQVAVNVMKHYCSMTCSINMLATEGNAYVTPNVTCLTLLHMLFYLMLMLPLNKHCGVKKGPNPGL